ncbi:MAG: porin [bacterium]|nr:porin [bacterium]
MRIRILKSPTICGWAFFLLFLALAPSLQAEENPVLPKIFGYLQTWWTISEQVKNGIRQEGSSDPAAQEAFGFSLARARVGLSQSFLDDSLGFKLEVKLEEGVEPLDYYIYYKPFPFLNLYLGQMKIPSTYEVLQSDSQLDFISRTQISDRIPDWSLSRDPIVFDATSMTGILTRSRDLGLALKGQFREEKFQYFLMMSNGLGANRFISGREKKGFFVSNGPGNMFYGLRLEAKPLSFFSANRYLSLLTIGGHFNYNHHPNMLYNDERVVFDLNRISYSGDLRAELPYRLFFTSLYAGGKADNSEGSSETDYRYQGYEFKVMEKLFPEKLELGFRYDRYRYKFSNSNTAINQQKWTWGANYYPYKLIKIQLDYVLKETDDPELAYQDPSSLVYANFQVSWP